MRLNTEIIYYKSFIDDIFIGSSHSMIGSFVHLHLNDGIFNGSSHSDDPPDLVQHGSRLDPTFESFGLVRSPDPVILTHNWIR